MAAQHGPTKTSHSATYGSISPTLPALSQSGKNVIITGGGTGIGQGIALSFAKASVTNLALLGRRLKPLEGTKNLINASYPDVSVHIYTADVADEDALNRAFSSFARATGGVIHTLIANAGVLVDLGKALDTTTESFMKGLATNALGTLNSVKAFMPHIPTEPDDTGFRARIIHVSSAAVHLDLPGNMSYEVGKLAGAKVMQHVAAEHQDIFVLNYHPGTIATAMSDIAAEHGFVIPKEDVSLPADWAVWAASPESVFLGSGRFLWAHWDVNELKESFGRYKSGEEKDGGELMGMQVGKNFTLGLLSWT